LEQFWLISTSDASSISFLTGAAESFSAWLRQHPEIVTISRDRCGLYAEGATLGAPQSQ
jgi:hypothetical protein